MPPCAFKFVSYRAHKVGCLGFPIKRHGEEREKEGMENCACESLVFCVVSGQVKGQCYGSGEMLVD